MSSVLPGLNNAQTIQLKQKYASHDKPTYTSSLFQANPSNQIIISAGKKPTELILQAAMEKINAVFEPFLGNKALEKAQASGEDYSPKATADRIMSFANHLIGRAEIEQMDFPVEERRSREQLFNNVQQGIEDGFKQARDILEGLQALQGETKTTVDSTYDYVQQNLAELSKLLGLQSDNPIA